MKVLLKHTIFTFIILFLTSCATTTTQVSSKHIPKSGEDSYSQAVASLGVDNYEEAKKYFIKALNANYKPVGCYYYLGLIEYQTGNLKKAEEYLLKCVKLDNSVTDAHNTLGAIYAKKKEYRKAIQEFLTVLKDKTYLYPENALYNLALLYYNIKQYDKSILYCEKSLKFVPKSPAVLYLIGLNLYKKGLKNKAILIMQRIIKEFPDNIWSSKANIFLEKLR